MPRVGAREKAEDAEGCRRSGAEVASRPGEKTTGCWSQKGEA